ncbi:MAG: YraN family protein [Pseudomonadota bacterium]
MSGSVGYHAGLAAEDIVANDYAKRHHDITARRWRGKSGEIDLIARDGDTVVFIEVKKSRNFATAATRLGHRQIERIVASASEFLAGEPRGQLTDVRFDLAVVNGVGGLKVIENAFMEA